MAKKTAKKPAPKKAAPRPAAKAKTKSAAKPAPTLPPPPTPPPPSAYEKFRDQQARISRDRSESGRDIGPLPPVKDAARRERCRLSLRLFCETYLSIRFYLGWCNDHLKAIAKLESAILRGGLFALAMPRGAGKTALAEAAALWAILYGHRQFVVLIGATDEAAVEMLDSIKIAIEVLDELAEDFPGACHPIRKMEGINNRAGAQTLDGERTRISWTNDEAIFPTVVGAASSGARIRVAGILGRVRGMKATTADGQTIRPDFVIPDDPQTDASAVSLVDIDKRERRLRGTIKGLAGPRRTIAMFVPCTVIAPRDLSDRILDRNRNPQFQGERMRMVYQFPKNQELWNQYKETRQESLRNDGKGEEASEFYREHREVMDEGAVVAWPERFDPESEVSGLQAAMNLWADNPAEFYAEYQNDPLEPDKPPGSKELVAEALISRLSGLPRYEIPRESTRLTAFVDVGGELHWYGVVAWDGRFGGTVIDYGSFPRQNRPLFAANDPQPGLSAQFRGLSETERIYAGLVEIVNDLAARTFLREGTGEQLRIERLLVDCGWQSATIYRFCRETPHAGLIYPSKGIGRTTTARGVSEWKARPGERSGHHWRLTMSETGRGRMVQFDPDAWKTFLHERFTTPMGGAGCLTFFAHLAGQERRPADHEMIAGHCCAEYAEPVTLRGATFDKWQVRVHQPDNHLWDVLVGCAVAASVQGSVWSPTREPHKAEPKKKIKWSEIQARKRAEREAART